MGDGRPQFPRSTDPRRIGPRRRASIEVCLFDEFGEPVVMETLDLGPSGMFVRSDLVYEPGEELFVNLRLEAGPTFMVRGRVVRAQLGESGSPAGMGIKFVGLTPREERWLRWYAESRSGVDSPVPVLTHMPAADYSPARQLLP